MNDYSFCKKLICNALSAYSLEELKMFKIRDNPSRQMTCFNCGVVIEKSTEHFCSNCKHKSVNPNQWVEEGYSVLLKEEAVEIIKWPKDLSEYSSLSERRGTGDAVPDLFKNALKTVKLT